jgi:outer membrane protein assembly factor BamB
MKRILVPLSLGFLASSALADDVLFLTATSRNRQNVIEFMNPTTGAYEATRVIGRRDRFANSPHDYGTIPIFVVDILGISGGKHAVPQSDLTNGTTYFYSVFVYDGGSWAEGRHITAAPVDTVNTPIRWRFSTRAGATLMSPPGIGSVLLVASNDKTLYPLERGDGSNGGRWASEALPSSLSGVSYHRPPVIPPTGTFAEHSVTFISTQDGILHCFNAETGAPVWDSTDFGMITGTPVGWFSRFSPAALDRVFIGTRNAGERNRFYALDIADGQPLWSFDDPSGIGIIPGSASIDYTHHAAYFASHEFDTGTDTVWAVDLLSGDRIWSTPVGTVSGSPVQRGLDLYVGTDAGLVYALDVRDGTVKPRFPFDTETGSPIKGFIFPNYAGPEVYFSIGSTIRRIRDTGTDIVVDWVKEVPGASIPTYPPGGEFLWVGSSDGGLYQLAALTGAASSVPLTSGPTPGVGNPSFDIVHGLIYVGTEDGAVFAVAAPY